MWFGLGRDQARFEREEFCLCCGLKMGTLPEGFREKKQVADDSILSRYFDDKRPTVELLDATFKHLTIQEGDDALKIAYLLMVSQFFGTDEGRTAISTWLVALVEDEKAFKSFSWDFYIFDVTFFWLKNAAEKHFKNLRGQNQKKDGEKKKENEENKLMKKKKKKKAVESQKKIEVEDGEKVAEQVNNDNMKPQEDGQQKNDSNYFTFNIWGFPLTFQDIGGNDMFSPMENFDDDKNIMEVQFANVNSKKFDGDTADLEKGVGETGLSENTDSETLVDKADGEADSETCLLKKGAVGETVLLEKAVGKTGLLKKADGETHVDKADGMAIGETNLLEKGAFGETILLEKGVSKTCLLEISVVDETVVLDKGVGVIGMLVRVLLEEGVDEKSLLNEGAIRDTVLLEEGVGEKGDGDTDDKADGTEHKLVQQPIYVDEYSSPVVNMVIPNIVLSVTHLDVPDPNVSYKNNDKKRDRKRSMFLRSPYTNLMLRKNKKTQESDEVTNQDYIDFTTFLKNKYQVR
ncbi:hypothetical protein Dsin_000728 [Dipteronia sinensis]|uniref:DUF1985 domain-containing protein n=1 Tax=Dipteronia sinensis TaxID=43782 RepID=A0AAE0EIB5_9ROSI|nr:hypothetical protein Dsin_000728 [Dipteronia sinensis]